MKWTKFFVEEKGAIMFTGLALLIFAVLFALLKLPWAYYWPAAGLLVLALVLYLFHRAMNFKDQESAKDRADRLELDLRQAQDDHRMKQKEMEEYFLLWAHQIKTPITSSFLLLDDKNEVLDREALKHDMFKIQNYTDSALNFVKLADPSRDMMFSRVSIDDLVRPLLKKYRFLFINLGISLHYETEEAVVLTDPNLAQLVLEQILSNALKYSPGGDIWITYDSNSQILTIRDNGVGIRPEDLPKIFDRGYSGFNGQLNEKSSGIGLYLVRKIADRLSLSVTVDSVWGQGSAFHIFFKH